MVGVFEPDTFIDFGWLDQKKELDFCPEAFKDEVAQQINERFEAVRETFELPRCDVCKDSWCAP